MSRAPELSPGALTAALVTTGRAAGSRRHSSPNGNAGQMQEVRTNEPVPERNPTRRKPPSGLTVRSRAGVMPNSAHH